MHSESRIRRIVPAVAPWRSFRGAFANVLVFGLAILTGEWTVHQVEYLLEYGRGFGTIMATSPHRFYMAPEGGLLAAALVLLLALGALALRTMCGRQQRLLSMLPARLQRHVPASAFYVSWRSLGRSALILAAVQIALYLIQENVESVAVGNSWPGLWAVLAPQHATVLPLHLLAAACGSLLLWTAAASLGRSRHTVRVAEILADIVTRQQAELPVIRPADRHIPDLRPVVGSLGLRAPPLAA